MNYWLIKSEPNTYSWDDLVKKGRDMWDGVRNFAARNHLKAMKTGEKALFYHSGKNPEIIGLAEVVKEYYPDPTAKEGDWVVVDFVPVKKFKKSLSLAEIKGIKALKEMVLVNNTRLSVQPVKKEEFDIILSQIGD